MSELVILPGGFPNEADMAVAAAAKRRRQREWGPTVSEAVCDHRPERHRLYDFRNQEIPVIYFACATCKTPMFLGLDGKPVQVYRAEVCGCTSDDFCSFHGHPAQGDAS